MPVTLDVTKEIEVDRFKKDYEKGVEIELTPEQKGRVVLTRYISTDPLHADWQPQGNWFQQVTSDIGGTRKRRPRILVDGLNGEPRGVNIDDGLIIDLNGTLTRIVGIVPGRPPMDEDDVEQYIDATDGQPVPMFQQWDFRITRVLKTNGPQARLDLSRTDEQKRKSSQAEMFDTFTTMFREGMTAMQAKGNISPSADEVLEAGKAAIAKKE